MTARRAHALTALIGAVLAALALGPAQQAGPPFPPADALRTFRLADGFQIELFAAEPLIASPVAMEIDEGGRLFVVEMPGYPLDVSGTGRIKLLQDTDGDGLPDRSVIFAEGLRLPTGIMKWKTGVLVTDSPQVWYLEDTDNDGRADIKREVLTGFALSNPQHTTNSPTYGLDNWIYLANEGPVRTIRYRDLFGDAGGEVRFSDQPTAPRLPPDADGRNVRFRPDTHELEALSSRSQFGQTFDGWGHQFLVTHNRHIIHEVIAARYLSRNPSLVVPAAIEHVPDYPLPAALFPITRNPEFQLLTDIGVMTAASGITWYLGDLFPPEFRSAVFVAEGAHNLVHAAVMRNHGATFRASRLFDDREFLASTDAWFRPVNMYIGPDGALYLIDYYRKILEHPEWMDEALARSDDLYAGQDRGRIYRIVPKGTAAPRWLGRTELGRATITGLVEALNRPNIWWRRHAQRLLVDRKPDDAAQALASMAARGDTPVARVHALWTLDGLNQLEPAVIARALRDPVAGVRQNAVKLAELHLSRAPALATDLLSLAGDPDPKVRYQLLLTLGDLDTPEAAAARLRLLFANVEDDWMQIAALSAASPDHQALFRESVARLGGRETTAARALFGRLGAMAGAAKDPRILRAVLNATLGATEPAAVWWQSATLAGVASGLPADRRKSPELEPERSRAAEAVDRARTPALRRALVTLLETIGLPGGAAGNALAGRAEQTATSAEGDPEARADAVRLLALRDPMAYQPVFRSLLERAEPTPVHVAAVRALAEPKGDRIVASFPRLWERWTPAVREEAIRALVREPGRVRLLLDAVADGTVKVSEIEWPFRVRMMMADDDTLRGRARALFGRTADEARDVLDRYREATTLPGSVERGRTVFARSCAMCHQYRGSGGVPFGPDLGEVRGRLPPALLADILRPNQSIADGFELWVAELADGSTVTGVIAAETPTSVTFRHAGGGETSVSRTRIRAMRIEPLSAMPEGLDTQIDLQQMADLIAFIKGGQ